MPDNKLRVQQILDYSFKDESLLLTAIVHPGTKQCDREYAKQFERLEFLGDRVLGLSVSTCLCELFPKENEGDIAVRFAYLTGTDCLIDLAKKSYIFECFIFPSDFFISMHKNSSSIADMMEATFGAIYLDAGFDVAKTVIANLYGDNMQTFNHKIKDHKSSLQELVQSRVSELPAYRMLKMDGKAHDPVFEIEVRVGDHKTIGYGNSKKSAEQDAAESMMRILMEKWH